MVFTCGVLSSTSDISEDECGDREVMVLLVVYKLTLIVASSLLPLSPPRLIYEPERKS